MTVRVVTNPVDQVLLTVRRGELEEEMRLLDDGRNGDELPGDGVFGVRLGRHDHGTTLEYRLRAYAESGAARHLPSADGESWIRIDVGNGEPPVRLNEFMASNRTTLADEFGEYDDWVELVGLEGGGDVSLEGFFLTDDPLELTKWKFPTDMKWSPDGRVVIWCDDDPEQGVAHTTFKLSADGEFLALVDPDGRTLIDSIDFGPQGADLSHGRFSDRSGPWEEMLPTPNGPNRRGDQVGGVLTLAEIPDGSNSLGGSPDFSSDLRSNLWGPVAAGLVPVGQKRFVSWNLDNFLGEGPRFVGVDPSIGWFHLEPDVPNLSLSGSFEVDAVFDASGMTPGIHRSWAWVENEDGHRVDLPIAMTVLPAGTSLEGFEECLEVFSGETVRTSLQFYLESGSIPRGVLSSLEVRCEEAWLAGGPTTVHPSADAPTAMVQLELLIDAHDLGPGRHEAEVRIISQGGKDFAVPVCANVFAPVMFEETSAARLTDTLVVNQTLSRQRVNLWALELDGAPGPVEEFWFDPFEVRSLAELMPGSRSSANRCVRVGIADHLVWDEICLRR